MTTTILFDAAIFRAECPAFANSTTYPDATIEGYWNQAVEYVSDMNYGALRNEGRRLAINLMTAHLMALNAIVAAGQVPGMVSGSTIDKISVTLHVPPLRNQWRWWLSLTPYGQRLLALLQVRSAGGFYVGGAPERTAFRNFRGC